nr:MAG TPA: hypothetical protein [Caudoviricetes sp.]
MYLYTHFDGLGQGPPPFANDIQFLVETIKEQ